MFEDTRSTWKTFASRTPGTRFRARYRRRSERPSGTVRKYAIIGIGLVLMLIGVALLVLPGPGILMLLLGAGLIAEESLIAARGLDRIELWITRRVQRWRRQRNSGSQA
ncbi:MAG TPA: PGPGW domain-containing protein [Dokdonella sp.]|nr:PGPGW domain-containing protein [Dokdonella sp.]